MNVFVVPAFDGPITGGTRYDAELFRALAEHGVSARAVDLDTARGLLSAGETGPYFVDSLFLREVPELRARGGQETKLAILLHYLPSLLASALGDDAAEPARLERAAFESVETFVVPSELTKRELERRVRGAPRIVAIEPGCTLRPPAVAPSVDSVVAQVVANLVRNKGIRELLLALRAELSATDDFSLRIAGDESAEPPYARACRSVVEEHAALRSCVHFYGPLDPASVEERLRSSNLFVSASLTETYGMALAEARAAGVPLLALDAGNAAHHVSQEAGGELVATHEELAAAFVRLCRDRAELERRLTLARASAFSNEPRTWADAAREFRQAFG